MKTVKKIIMPNGEELQLGGTTENDTVPLFTGMYFDFTPNNVSWLKAGQQANSGGIYAFTYNELVNILNGETKYGDLKVINVADMVTGEDYSEYWKVNQEDMTFITPIRTDERVLVEKKEPTSDDPTWYSLYSDGWCEQGGFVGNITPNAWVFVNFLKPYINTNYTVIGSGVDPSVSTSTPDEFFAYRSPLQTTGFYGGIRYLSGGGTFADRGFTWQTSGYTTIPTNTNLYFKVANAVQNLELLDAGEVLEAVNNVVPNNRLVWDGQWQGITNGVVLLQNVGAGSYNFDLSQYLPNDNNPYEILCGVTTYGDTYISFESNGIKTGTVHGGGQSIVFQVVVPVSATKQLIVNVMTGTSANAVVAINNYRRLGTNI